MSNKPGDGSVDGIDWGPLIAALADVSRNFFSAIEQQNYDEARRLGDRRLALLVELVQYGKTKPYPPELTTLVKQILEQEQSSISMLEREKQVLGEQIAKMVTGNKASALYKKSRE